MGRIKGATYRVSRRLGFSILETGKEFIKGKQRKTIPGQHGTSRPKKKSDYGLHLAEKQKVRYMYGLTDKQLRLCFEKASKKDGVAGTNLLQALESRLDNLVYRSGLAKTRRQARQFVSHAHFTINGKNTNIPSMLIPIGTTIVLKQKSLEMKELKEAIERSITAPWITLDKERLSFSYDRLPNRDELNKEINDALVVEFYN